MTAHSSIAAKRIAECKDVAQIDALIAALVAYRPVAERRPILSRGSVEYLAVLEAMNSLEGCDALIEQVSELRYDLAPCEGCGRVHCSCDDGFFDDASVRVLGDGSARVEL